MSRNIHLTQAIWDDVKILAKKDKVFRRKVREAVAIYKIQPALNRDHGQEIQPNDCPLNIIAKDGTMLPKCLKCFNQDSEKVNSL